MPVNAVYRFEVLPICCLGVGYNPSPPLLWNNTPGGTRSFVGCILVSFDSISIIVPTKWFSHTKFTLADILIRWNSRWRKIRFWLPSGRVPKEVFWKKKKWFLKASDLWFSGAQSSVRAVPIGAISVLHFHKLRPCINKIHRSKMKEVEFAFCLCDWLEPLGRSTAGIWREKNRFVIRHGRNRVI